MTVPASSHSRRTSATSPTAPSMPLAVGAVWRGHQRSGMKSYDVEVRIAGVDESSGDVCGTLTIKHLLPTLPKVVTFFDGEIIGPSHHDFVTDKWGASEEDDHAHWDKFRRDIYLRGNPVSASVAPSAYASPIPTAPSSEYGGSDDEDEDEDDFDTAQEEDYDAYVNRQLRRKRRLEKKRESFKVPPNVVFMRLKERCFVNDKEGRDLSEASFDGFYYIAVELNPAPDRPQLSISKTAPFASSGFRSGSSTPPSLQSLLSATAPHNPSGLASRRPFGPSLVRSDSYAAVVRGRTSGLAGSGTGGAPSSSLANSGKPDDLTYQNTSQACESEIPGEIATARPIYSPSLEEFPFPPPSPSSLPSSLPVFGSSFTSAAFEDTFRARSRSSSSSLHRSVARAGLALGVAALARRNAGFNSHAGRSTNVCTATQEGGNRLSTNFYNAKTGYKGPWAHAVMRGFYFTPPPSFRNSSPAPSNDPSADDGDNNDNTVSPRADDSNDDDARDTYQELELFYVGDGLGAMLEENEDEEEQAVDEWGNVKPIDEMKKIKKDLLRRQMYARPKASASFTVM
ncbi:hypothetical protein P389DRAFT_191133 [Cystobasidium minutum MCA 4210]|uniref:uncharacterized protein n=1 Tax=Cystobasidium minutum MCA 4210 TaxID=1397322 RepID=UPI0034CD0958|eukprot:jgi/Rhomi1/191133/estExt_fgenesh1_pg.C_70117